MRNKGLLLAAALTLVFAAQASADTGGPDHSKGALGFRSTSAPIGVRWWLNDMLALDAGVGFTSEKFNFINSLGDPDDETFSTVAVDLGLPIRLRSWEQVHFIFRPGFIWQSTDDISYFIITDEKEKRIDMTVTGELELEVFLAKNASISAAHGVGFASTKLDVDDAESDTIFGTFGSNFTTLGFHVYLFPASE